MKTYLIVWVIGLANPTFYHQAFVWPDGKTEIIGCIPSPLIACEDLHRYYQDKHFEIVQSSNVPTFDSRYIPGIIEKIQVYDLAASTAPIKVWKP